MKDVLHSPVADESTYKCYRCDIALPSDVVMASGGSGVIDVGGLGDMFIPAGVVDQATSVSCTHPSVTKIKQLAEAVDEVEVLEEQEGEKPNGGFTVTEFEKRVSQQAYANWWGMREMTRPGGYDEVS